MKIISILGLHVQGTSMELSKLFHMYSVVHVEKSNPPQWGWGWGLFVSLLIFDHGDAPIHITQFNFYHNNSAFCANILNTGFPHINATFCTK